MEGNRDGYLLICFGEVNIRCYSLTLRQITVQHKFDNNSQIVNLFSDEMGFARHFFQPEAARRWISLDYAEIGEPIKSCELFTCFVYINPFTPKSDQCQKFPCSLTRNMTSHSKENLAFHSLLRWKMILIQILTTSLMHFPFRRLGECTFWAQEWKV